MLDSESLSNGVDLSKIATESSSSKQITGKLELSADDAEEKVTADLELTNSNTQNQSTLAGKNLKVTIGTTVTNCALKTTGE